MPSNLVQNACFCLNYVEECTFFGSTLYGSLSEEKGFLPLSPDSPEEFGVTAKKNSLLLSVVSGSNLSRSGLSLSCLELSLNLKFVGPGTN